MDGKQNWLGPRVGTKDGGSFMPQKIDCTMNKDDNIGEFVSEFLFLFFIEGYLEPDGLKLEWMDLFSFFW